MTLENSYMQRIMKTMANRVKAEADKITSKIAKATGTSKEFVKDSIGTAFSATGAYVVVEAFTNAPNFVSCAAACITTAVMWSKLRKTK